MNKKDLEKWYENLPDNVRMKLQRDFDTIYDKLGNRETKFYKWLKNNTTDNQQIKKKS